MEIRKILFLCAALVVGGFSVLGAVETSTFVEESSKTEFPKSVNITFRGQAYNLEATGAAVRRKWFIKGYAIAHYMQSPIHGDLEKVLKDIFSDEKPKQMTMHWLHRLPLHLIKEGYEETLVKVLNQQDYNRLKPDIDKYLSWFKQESKVGDVHYIRWLPGGTLELIINDQKAGSLVNAELAKAVWTMWFGPESVVDRQKLIGFVLN